MKSTWIKNRIFVSEYEDQSIINLYNKINDTIEDIIDSKNKYIQENISLEISTKQYLSIVKNIGFENSYYI